VGEVAHLQVDHVGGGVDDAERAVDLKGISKGAALKALTQDELENIARENVLLGAAHRL
jgi:hypothetical protein